MKPDCAPMEIVTAPAVLHLSCMGGWCALRDHCPHYHAGHEGTRPSERLCFPRSDGKSDVVDIRVQPAATSVLPSQVIA